jgi:hypothetical protein
VNFNCFPAIICDLVGTSPVSETSSFGPFSVSNATISAEDD